MSSLIYGKHYVAVHNYLKYHYGKAYECHNKNCKYDSGFFRKFHWAKLKDKKYEKKRENFIMLCTSCHSEYDRNTLKSLEIIPLSELSSSAPLENVTNRGIKKIKLKEKITLLRKGLGNVSRLNLSRELNLKTETAIWNWEKGISSPSYEHTLKLINFAKSIGIEWKIEDLRPNK